MANVEKFKYWCNKILPLVYDDSLSYYEFLGKVYEKLNETIDAVNSNTEAVAEFDQRINDFIAAETEAREGWEDQQERDRQSWEDQQAQKWSAFQSMFISEYDPDDVYVQGDLCSVQYKMYVANASTTGTFDPTKWDEIVLSDYLAEYVSAAAGAMQTQYNNFLADYQRTFGIVQTTGSSTTDAMSQNAVTIYGFRLFLLESATDLDDCYKRGIYEWGASLQPSNAPFEGSGSMVVFTQHMNPSTSYLRTVQLIFDQVKADPKMWYRYDTSSGWSDWCKVATDNYVDEMHNEYGLDIKQLSEAFDLNSATRGIYFWGSSNIPQNTPETSAQNGMCVTLRGRTLDSTLSSTGTIQMCVQSHGVYIRHKRQGSSDFTAWALIGTTADEFNIENRVFNSPTIVEGALDINDPRPIHFWFEYQGYGSIRITLYNDETALYQTGLTYINSGDEIRHLEITVPSAVRAVNRCRVAISGRGTNMTIHRASIYRGNVCKKDTAILFCDHCGIDGLYPTGSYNGVEYAAKMGFSASIVIPKRTSDGVWVCFHDDDTISNMMRMPDGSAIPVQYDLPVSQLTYDQLMQFSIGAKKSVSLFGSYKILTMDNFFRICAKTGMRPIFSIHPGLSVENWAEINVLLKKWGLYGKLGVKTPNVTQINRAKANTSVYEFIYIYPVAGDWNILDDIASSDLDANDRVIVEFFHQSFDDERYIDNATAQFEAVKAAGYMTGLVIDNQNNDYINGFINQGMTEFTTSNYYNIYNVTD